MTIVLRSAKGAPLSVPELDGNFSALDTRLAAIENGAAASVEGVASISVVGNQMTLTGTHGTSWGPFALPTGVNPRGTWTTAIYYSKGDLLTEPEGTTVICTVAHLAGASYDASKFQPLFQASGGGGGKFVVGTGSPVGSSDPLLSEIAPWTDAYLDAATWDIWQQDDTGTWAITASLPVVAGPAGADGAPGPAGADGADGRTWHYGSAAPDAALGVDGDLHLNTTTWTVSAKETGAWVAKGAIKGADGADGAPGPAGADGAMGPAGPAGADGADGQGVPAGGTTGQILAKSSGADFDTAWVTAPTGGAALTSTVSPSAPATTAAIGVSTEAARADHAHRLPTPAEIGAVSKGEAEVQADVLGVQVDNTLDPGASPAAGSRYVISSVYSAETTTVSIPDSSGEYASMASTSVKLAQQFVLAAPGNVASIEVSAQRPGTGLGNIQISIYADDGAGNPTGSALATGTVSRGSTGLNTFAWTKISFASPVSLAAGSYMAVISNSTSNNTDFKITSANPYGSGAMRRSSDSGATWGYYTGSAAFDVAIRVNTVVNNLHANFGAIAALGNGDIAEYSGSAWTVAYDVSARGAGALVYNRATGSWMSWTGSTWSHLATAPIIALPTSGTATMALGSSGHFTMSPIGAVSVAISIPTATGDSTKPWSFALRISYGGAVAVTWPSSFKWSSGTAPTLTAVGHDLIVGVSYDNGLSYLCVAHLDVK